MSGSKPQVSPIHVPDPCLPQWDESAGFCFLNGVLGLPRGLSFFGLSRGVCVGVDFLYFLFGRGKATFYNIYNYAGECGEGIFSLKGECIFTGRCINIPWAGVFFQFWGIYGNAGEGWAGRGCKIIHNICAILHLVWRGGRDFFGLGGCKMKVWGGKNSFSGFIPAKGWLKGINPE